MRLRQYFPALSLAFTTSAYAAENDTPQPADIITTLKVPFILLGCTSDSHGVRLNGEVKFSIRAPHGVLSREKVTAAYTAIAKETRNFAVESSGFLDLKVQSSDYLSLRHIFDPGKTGELEQFIREMPEIEKNAEIYLNNTLLALSQQINNSKAFATPDMRYTAALISDQPIAEAECQYSDDFTPELVSPTQSIP